MFWRQFSAFNPDVLHPSFLPCTPFGGGRWEWFEPRRDNGREVEVSLISTSLVLCLTESAEAHRRNFGGGDVGRPRLPETARLVPVWSVTSFAFIREQWVRRSPLSYTRIF